MVLAPGAHLAAYEITALIGSGGMGEVYRAHDAKLNRDVALKILPTEFALDADRLARFKREAQVLASLNHPNIGAIYGFEESDGVQALALELVEGPTLADRISHGPIPIDEALPIARQIADALGAAHEQGIVHRDLKPANIKLRDDGAVKVLDFGLAKLTEARASSTPSAGVSQSPTITTPAMMTGVGVILGTAAYMSPEQAKGRPADRRNDIWAFGCVLYEMLTGKRAFGGEDVADTLAAVLRGDPDWSALPADTAPAIQTIVRHCLARDRRARIANISTANFLLDEQIVSELDPAVLTNATSASGSPRRARLWMTAAVALATTVAGTTWVLRRRPTGPLPTMRFEITIPPSQTLTTGTLDRNIAISPDGTRLVYVSGAAFQLMLRPVDRLDAAPLGGIFGARFPFFSPDSKWVGYFAGNGELKKVSILGGPPITICRFDGPPRGAAWGADDTIVFAAAANGGLRTVSAGGGEPQVMTKPEPSTTHLLPSWLPDGRGVVFTMLGAAGANASIAVLDRRTGKHHVLLAGTEGEYVDSGYVVYVAQGTLRAVGFDAVSLAVVGDPVPLEQLATKGGQDLADFSVSRNGMLVFAAAGVDGQPAGNRTLVWVTRQGKEEAIAAPRHAYTSLRLSPDDSRIALDVREQQNNVWIWDVRAQTLTRLTDGPGDQVPAWTPDGRRIAFSSQRGGPRGLFWRSADGSGTLESWPESGVAKLAKWPGAFSPDGTLLVVTEIGDKTGDDVSVVSPDRNQPRAVLVNTPSSERSPDLSFDGRWLAYQSNEDGRDEIYVRPFPDVNGGRWQITTSGGTHAIWGKNGRELFFLDGEGFLTVVPIQASPGFARGRPTKLLQTKYFSAATRGAVYDVSRDGQRFVMIKGEEAAGRSSTLTVVLNWLEELKQRVPTR